MTAGFEFINPTARVSGGEATASSSKRIGAVEGLRVGLLDNGMPHAADFLGQLGASLERRFGVPVLMRRKGYTARSAESHVLDDIVANCDVVVTGFGV